MPHFETWVGWWVFWFIAIPFGAIITVATIKICFEILTGAYKRWQ